MPGAERITPNHISRPLGPGERPRGRAPGLLLDYWLEKRGSRPYPDWPEIELMDLWAIADCLTVKDVLAGGRDFQNRYWGTRLTTRLGAEGMGKTQSQLFGTPEQDDTSFFTYRLVAASGEPALSYRRFTYVSDHEHVTCEGIHLPLGPHGGPVAHVLSAIDFSVDLSDVLDPVPTER